MEIYRNLDEAYKGGFQNGLRHGPNGKLVHNPSHTNFEGERVSYYLGRKVSLEEFWASEPTYVEPKGVEWVLMERGSEEGTGTLTNELGDLYTGSFNNANERHGKGKTIYTNG